MLVVDEPTCIRVSTLRFWCAECLNNIRSTCWRCRMLSSRARHGERCSVEGGRRRGACQNSCWLSRERWFVVLKKLPGERTNLWRGMVAGVTMSLRLQKNDDRCWRRRGNASSKGILRGQIGGQPSRKWYVISLLCSMAWHDAVGAIELISLVLSSQWMSALSEGQVTVDVGQALHS